MHLIRTHHPDSFRSLDTAALRRDFLVTGLFAPGRVEARCWEVDRTVIGGAVPLATPLALETTPELRAEFFCERREVGVANLGGPGVLTVDGQAFALGKCDFAYVGRGAREVMFASDSTASPAAFYFVSYPAHAAHPSRRIALADTTPKIVGAAETCNRRSIHQMILPARGPSCQLVMGFTTFTPGSIWNTLPPHTHERRSEVYLYFDVPADQMVVHFLGQPQETRHLVVRDREAALSPGWSIHMGAGTAAYGFVWAMGGENLDYADIDPAPLSTLA
jgi:4-deoxy-L-threo-5-hexosulose-uronate ketol-isomerase